MSCQPRLIWYCLFDSSTGQPFLGTTADKVSVSTSADVADFRDAVHTKNASILTGIDASQLLVYKNKAYFHKRHSVDQGKEGPLDPTEPISFLGSKDDMLIVSVVTSQTDAAMSKIVYNNISEKLYQDLTVPFPKEPTIYDLKDFLSCAPFVPIPLEPIRYQVVMMAFQ